MSAAQDAPLCVFCRRQPAVREWRPFCCQRCSIQDLARWADASYRVAGGPADDHIVNEQTDDAQASVTKSSD